jgi:TolA-binding protein
MSNEKTDLTFKERVNLGLSQHWKLATLIFTAVVVVMAGILILDYVSRGKRSDSAMLAEDIQDTYTSWMQDAPDVRDNSELEVLIADALEDYPKQFAAQRALFTRGLMALENENWEEASAAFATIADSWENSYLAPVSLYNAGSAREEAGDTVGAVEYWTRLVDEYAEVSPDAPEALFNLGRIAETLGDNDKALQHYGDVNSRFPESRWTDLSKSRILLIEGRS